MIAWNLFFCVNAWNLFFLRECMKRDACVKALNCLYDYVKDLFLVWFCVIVWKPYFIFLCKTKNLFKYVFGHLPGRVSFKIYYMCYVLRFLDAETSRFPKKLLLTRARLFWQYTITDSQPLMYQRTVLKKIFVELMPSQKKCSVLQD